MRYCPWWCEAFWQAKELNGAVEPWQLWDCDHYKGLGRVVSQMGSALTAAMNAAQSLADEHRKNDKDKPKR